MRRCLHSKLAAFCVKKGNSNICSYLQVSNAVCTTYIWVQLGKLCTLYGLPWYHLQMEIIAMTYLILLEGLNE